MVLENFAWPGGRILPTPGPPRAFDTHVVFYPNISKHGGFYSKHKQIGSSVKDANDLYRFLQAGFSISLLIKAEFTLRNRELSLYYVYLSIECQRANHAYFA